MAAGGDKIITYDPPGAIGLVDNDALLLVRFDETDTTTRPKDETGVLGDLDIVGAAAGLTMPQLVDGAVGRARRFVPANLTGLAAKDLVPGSTLITRDLSIQVIMSWNAAQQLAAGAPGTIIARGLSTGTVEFVAYGLQIAVVDAPSFTGQLQWFWQDIAGTLHVEAGAQFVNNGNMTMLTATRRWISPTSVLLRYYIGDQLIGTVQSADGSIGGGTTGTTLIGVRTSAVPANINFLAGNIDELLVLDRELCAEEIEATWLRITKYQPLGVQLFRETIPRGFPIPKEPTSDPQLEIRMVGQVLGYAAAKAEEFRANFLPQRAYGQVLADWIEATRVTPAPGDDIDTKRSRVLARLRQKQGIAPPGIQVALSGLLGGAPTSALQLISLSNVMRDEFTTLDTLRWDMTPAAAATLVGNAARFTPAAGTYLAAPAGAWRTMVAPISQSTLANVVGQERILGKVQMVTPQSGAEVGVLVANRGADRYLLLGLRDNAGTFQIVTEVFDRWVSSGTVVRATLGGNPASLWLYLHQQSDGTWIAEWSTTSETTGYTASAPFAAFGTNPVYNAGAYFRSTGALAGAAAADVDMLSVYAPNGIRTFNAFVLLDRALGFNPDIAACRSVLREIRHGFTFATFITSRNCLANDPDCGAGVAPCGPLP